MHYVSAIRSPSGQSVDSFEYSLVDGHKYSLMMSSTNDDLNILIGRGVDYSSSSGVVVRHTFRTACLHRFVNVTDTRYCVTPLRHLLSDYINLDTGSFDGKGSDIVEVDMNSDTVSIFGSVCAWGIENRSLYTLYDTLSMLCRKAGRNLMSYETIQLGSMKNLWQSTIRLIHNADADRFFAKMYVDAMRG